MKLNTVYKETDVFNIYYFKYRVLNEEQLLTINYVDKTVRECSSSLEAFADIELDSSYEFITELEDLVFTYFGYYCQHYQQLANRYTELSKDIYNV